MPNPIDDNDKPAAAVGRVTSRWAHLELHLSRLFATLIGTDLTMAVTVFRFFKAVPMHCDVLIATAKASSRVTEAEIRRITEALKNYKDIAALENQIAYNPFGYTPDRSEIYIEWND